jgi:hypothetical protein
MVSWVRPSWVDLPGPRSSEHLPDSAYLCRAAVEESPLTARIRRRRRCKRIDCGRDAHYWAPPHRTVRAACPHTETVAAGRPHQRPLRPLRDRLRPLAARGAGLQGPCRLSPGAGEVGALTTPNQRPVLPCSGFESQQRPVANSNSLKT